MPSSTVEFLGQGGFRLSFPCLTAYLDPYLSDSVRILSAPDLERQSAIAIEPDKVTDADWVLLTHAHIDHCDPHTIPSLAKASPQAKFVGPWPVLALLRKWGIVEDRLVQATESWMPLGPDLNIRAVPAAHPRIERSDSGDLSCVGFVVEESDGQRAYFAGDTGLCDELIEHIAALGPYEVAFLPVNEQNYFRARRGIIGNMSIREAFGLAEEVRARRVFPCHWDMFAANSAFPEEIQLIHKNQKWSFALESGCRVFFGKPKRLASIVIRTLDEARYLDDLLVTISKQKTCRLDWEVVLVDSGSTDDTLEIAARHGCRIVHISRDEFSFGRSLNRGCQAAQGDVLVFISGHCVPTDDQWLERLCEPLFEGGVSYTYGRQIGDDDSYFSERCIFANYFPAESRLPQEDFFCNNANAALLTSAWLTSPFDEELTGLEDLDAAKRLYQTGHKIGYVAEAAVFHHHNENWASVRRRFQREAIALQKIMPEVQISKRDLARYISSTVWMDWKRAWQHRHFRKAWLEVILYRFNQYLGSFAGNHNHRKLSKREKEKFFYPLTEEKDEINESLSSCRRTTPDEGEQRAG